MDELAEDARADLAQNALTVSLRFIHRFLRTSRVRLILPYGKSPELAPNALSVSSRCKLIPSMSPASQPMHSD